MTTKHTQSKTAAEEKAEFMEAVSRKVNELSADVRRGGSAITLPDGLELRDAANMLYEMADDLEEPVRHEEEFEGWAPFDVVYQFTRAFECAFGPMQARGKEVQTPFGVMKLKPYSMRIPISHCEHTTVFMGEFGLPDGGKLEIHKGRIIVNCTRRSLGIAMALIEDTYRRLREQSIYKGKAWAYTDSGEPFEFIDHTQITQRDMVFPADITLTLEDEIFQFTRRPELKKPASVLLHGTYGTGKTLVGAALANECVKHQTTFCKLQDVRNMHSAIRTLRMYGGGVLFVEDGDRVLSGERSYEMDLLSQEIDGLNKVRDVMIVMTSNNAEAIHPLFLRPERMDAFIHLGECTPEHAALITQHYARSNGDVSAACGELLAGQTPATVTNVIKKALLRGKGRLEIERVKSVFTQMRFHLELLERLNKERATRKSGPTLTSTLSQLVYEAAREAYDDASER